MRARGFVLGGCLLATACSGHAGSLGDEWVGHEQALLEELDAGHRVRAAGGELGRVVEAHAELAWFYQRRGRRAACDDQLAEVLALVLEEAPGTALELAARDHQVRILRGRRRPRELLPALRAYRELHARLHPEEAREAARLAGEEAGLRRLHGEPAQARRLLREAAAASRRVVAKVRAVSTGKRCDGPWQASAATKAPPSDRTGTAIAAMPSTNSSSSRA